MSKTAWIFGDSFQASNFPFGQTESWCDILFQSKGYEVKNYSQAGVSTESIVLSCIDMIPYFEKDDLVLVFLSSIRRFMHVKGSGDITCTHEFKRYIDTEREHTDLWNMFEENNHDARILDWADKFNTPIADLLKHSVYNNYISMLLSSKGLNFKIIHGHYEPETVQSLYVQKYMNNYKNRVLKPEVTAYYDLNNAVKFKYGRCLINDFFHCQVEHLISTFGIEVEDFLKTVCDNLELTLKKRGQKARYSFAMQRYFMNVLTEKYGKENIIFFDVWHLNEHGQKIYAEYLKKYEWY